jgi:transmembrane sensor
MSSNTPYDDQAWDLIVSALSNDLSPEEEVRFHQWLDASADNREKFEQLSRVWASMDVGDFSVFEQADNVAAWNGLLMAMNARHSHRETTPADTRPAAGIRQIPETQTPKIPELHSPRRNFRWLAAAAVILLIAGAGWWIVAGKVHTYETAFGEQKTIILADGTTVTLESQTRLQVEPDFNTGNRIVALLGGTARFDVVHNAQKPFIVETGAARIQDIGTSFTIRAGSDSISVTVSQGMIAFLQKGAAQPRQIAAGGAICLYTGRGHSGEIRETSAQDTDSLRFENAPLSRVLATLGRHSGYPIRLTDSLAGEKKLTIDLTGESLEDALRVVCASMHLRYKLHSGVYIVY